MDEAGARRRSLVVLGLLAGLTVGLAVAAGDGAIRTNSALDRVLEGARRQRMPTMCEFREFAQRGCLITYGATLAEFHDRVARFVERILKGAKPADLPMEQATRFELVVNQKTAREIGMHIPPGILLRADHVIE